MLGAALSEFWLRWGIVACHVETFSTNWGLVWGIVACHVESFSTNCKLLCWGIVVLIAAALGSSGLSFWALCPRWASSPLRR